MSTATMAAGFAAAFLDGAVAQGAARDVLQQQSMICEDDLSKQDNRIPVEAYDRLIATAIEVTGDTALLLRHSLESQLEAMSVVGQIVHSSASLPHSIGQLNRYLRRMADIPQLSGTDRFELVQAKGELWIVDHLPVPKGDHLRVEASFARFISEFGRSFPEATFELAMEVTYAPPPHVAESDALFRIPVTLESNPNALRIDLVWTSAATGFEPGNDYAFAVFTRQADALLETLEAETTMHGMVEAWILPHLHEGSISVDGVAREAGMSRQTLYRRLKAKGLTFAEIQDTLRHRMALEFLSANRVSVNETVYLLGFSEASSFGRAFKRWTGNSPTSWIAGNA